MSEMSGLNNEDEQNDVTATEEPSPNTEPEAVTGEANADQTEVVAETTEEPVAETEATIESSDGEEAAAAQADTSDMDDDDAEPATDDDDDDEDTDTPQPETQRRSQYERGEIIEVTVLETTPTAVTVQLDERGEGFNGIIPGRELDRMSKDALDVLKPGETVKLYVVNTGDPNGNVVLSFNRAQEKLDWERAEQYQKERKIYEGVIAGYNKGGLIVRFGRLRGFIPQSQISDERRARLVGDDPDAQWSDMVKEEIIVKVIEVDRGRNRLILSERAAARETREARKAALIAELTLNEVRTGRVVSLEDFGAFVDIGGAEGLVHLTELSWGHVTHPKQVLNIGDEVTVEVINIDADRKRIGLSLKRQLPDPWDVVATDYREGQLVKAKITKLTKFGAFAELIEHPEVEGLVHISELSESRVGHPRDVVSVDEELTLRIVKMDVAERRLGLSLKAVTSTEYLDDDMNMHFD